jgi:predicted nuclease with RNAse H fold
MKFPKFQGEFVALFLGYDPGGREKNGVAAIRMASEIPAIIATDTVLDASEALSWLSAYSESAEALGIDTLLAWSPKGRRACDDALRRRYQCNSIVAQNSLYSAMTLNGAIVARRLGLPVYESHPKLLVQTISEEPIHQLYDQTIAKSGADHEGDAVIAAWCSAMGHTCKWTADLFSDIEDDIELVVPGARYPWFEPIDGT